MTDVEAHFYGGPLDGQWRAMPKSAGGVYLVVRPESMVYVCTEEINPVAPALVTGEYRHTPWTNDFARWDWQGWSDERVTRQRPLVDTFARNEYWPDAMRFDASVGDAEIDAWQQILHPDR